MTMAAVIKPRASRRKNLIVARSRRSPLNQLLGSDPAAIQTTAGGAAHRPKPGPPKISDALVPPKPNEFESTYLTRRSRVTFGTRLLSQEGDGLSRLRVGGTTPSRIARIENIASTLPAAPSRCPIADLVEDIASR